MDPTHPDFPLLKRLGDWILARVGGADSFSAQMPEVLQEAIDFVIDPVRTGRTRIVDLDNVEKTFIGLKVEHFFRDLIDVPKGLRDLEIDGVDVDVKNTVSKTWTIPPETYRNSEPVLLFLIAEQEGSCSVGIMVAKPEYLNAGLNRDGKKAVSAASKAHIYWLIERQALPDSRWSGLDMERFRELRRLRPGTLRAAQFFAENLDVKVHRSVIQSLLHDQQDYMKRLRFNGGARDLLKAEGIVLLAGLYDRPFISALGLPECDRDEFIAHRLTPVQRELLDRAAYF